jgi:pyrroloquinoline quinone biosynthesis protein E
VKNHFKNDYLKTYPVRKSHLKIQSLSNMDKVINFHNGSALLISTVKAMALELCSGEYNIDSIIEICKGTFRLDRGEAMQHVLDILNDYEQDIKFLSVPLPTPIHSDPMRIFKSNRSNVIANVQRDDYPSELTLSVSYRCNHRCCYCSNSSGDPIPDEMSESEWLRVIDEAKDLGVLGITFSGGEPIMFPGIFSLVKRTVENEMFPIISTNGTFLTEKAVAKLAESGSSFIHLSLSAASDELYDKIVGCQGNLSKVKQAIKNLKKYGFYIRAKVILVSLNISEVESILNICHDEGVDSVHLEPFRLTHISREGKELIPSRQQLEKVVAISERKAVSFGTRTLIIAPAIDDLRWNGPSDVVKCGGVKTDLTILSNGNATFCEALANSRPDFTIGNVRVSKLISLWESDKPESTLQLRSELVDEPCRSCDLLESCKTGCFMCSLIYSDNPWSVDPRCWKADIQGNAFRT